MLTRTADGDYAVSILSGLLGKTTEEAFFRNRSLVHPFTIYNTDTGFMEARNADGTWAGPDVGWTEGDKWAYTFDVVHDVPGLIDHRGGKANFVAFLDEHFDGGKCLHFPLLKLSFTCTLLIQATTSTRTRHVPLKNGCLFPLTKRMTAIPSYSIPLCISRSCDHNTNTRSADCSGGLQCHC